MNSGLLRMALIGAVLSLLGCIGQGEDIWSSGDDNGPQEYLSYVKLLRVVGDTMINLEAHAVWADTGVITAQDPADSNPEITLVFYDKTNGYHQDPAHFSVRYADGQGTFSANTSDEDVDPNGLFTINDTATFNGTAGYIKGSFIVSVVLRTPSDTLFYSLDGLIHIPPNYITRY